MNTMNTNQTRPGHTTRLNNVMTSNLVLPNQMRPGRTTRLTQKTRPGHTTRPSPVPPMPLRRWGTLLLVALAFLARTATAAQGFEENVDPQGIKDITPKDNRTILNTDYDGLKEGWAKVITPKGKVIYRHEDEKVDDVPESKRSTINNKVDADKYYQFIKKRLADQKREFSGKLAEAEASFQKKLLRSSDKSAGIIRTREARKLEDEYQDAVRKVKIGELYKRGQKKGSTLSPRVTTLYTRDWINKDGSSRSRLPPKDDTTIRVLQFNILAHGLSNLSSGFAAHIKEHITEDTYDDTNKTHLESEAVVNLLMGEAYKNREESAKQIRKATGETLKAQVPLRFNRILGIILKQNPDVITMQEVDHYYDFMLPKLRAMGYDGIFKPKHKSTCARWNGGLPDGVAVFWNKERIANTGEEVPIGYEGTSMSSLYEDEKKKKRSSQVAIAVKLKIIETNQEFLMMTAHLASGNKKKTLPIKKAQGKEVAGIIAKYNHDQRIPVVFACDFNNRPGGVTHKEFFRELRDGHCPNRDCDPLPEGWTMIRLMSGKIKYHHAKTKQVLSEKPLAQGWIIRKSESGEIEYYHEKTKKVLSETPKYGPEDRLVAPSRQDGRCALCATKWEGGHNTQVTSAYANVLGKEPAFTTDKWRKGGNQPDKRGKTAETIDYIFYTNEFECSRVLGITKDPIEHVRMPGWRYPSDHFSIVADLKLPERSSSVRSRPSNSPKSMSSTSPRAAKPARARYPRLVRKLSKRRRESKGSPRSPKRRRMAQREFSPRRDSRVMTSLLEEIDAANQKHNGLN